MSGTPVSRTGWRALLPASFLLRRIALLSLILTMALIAFEVFNYSTTELALRDLLGDLRFAGIHWATILAVAFCSIDFAGIARLFIPEDQRRTSSETWFLLSAWLLAASMNAILTWWGISLSLVNRTLISSAFIPSRTLIEIVPVFAALLVWLTRILLIGSFSLTSQRLTSDLTQPAGLPRPASRPTLNREERYPVQPAYAAPARPSFRPTPRPASSTLPEPEYIPEPGYAARQSPESAVNSRVEHRVYAQRR